MRVTATALKNHLGKYLETSIKEPVIVEKSGRPSAVLISFDVFEELSHYEDFYWSTCAALAEKEGYLGVDQTAEKLKKYAQRAGVEMDDEETGHHEKR